MANESKIEVIGGYLVVTDVTTNEQFIRKPRASVVYNRTDADVFYFTDNAPTGNFSEAQRGAVLGVDADGNGRSMHPFADTVDDTGAAWTSADDLETFLANNTGFFFDESAVTVEQPVDVNVLTAPPVSVAPSDYKLEVARGNVAGQRVYNKFGANTDIDTGSVPEDLHGGAGVYTAFNITTPDSIRVFSGSVQDVGTLVSSGTATGGTSTTLVDTGANFTGDGVAVGDCVINDTQAFHGIITNVTATVLTVVKFTNGNPEQVLTPASSDSYRVANASGTGIAVLKMNKMLESDYDGYKTEYIITNGTVGANTVGTDYIRSSRGVAVLAGSGGSAASSIAAVQTGTGSLRFFSIPSGHNQSLVAADTIPKGYTLYVNGLVCRMARSSGAAGSAEVDFYVRGIGQNVFNSKVHEYITDADGFKSGEGYILAIPEYSDYKWTVNEVSDNNTQLSAEINGYLVENNS